jgi:hypothetical protein
VYPSQKLKHHTGTESKKPDENNFLASMMNRLQMGGLGGEDSSSSKEPSFLEQNLQMFMDMSIRVCEAESKGSFYHAQRVLRVCLQEHTDDALSYLFSTSEDKAPPPLFRYFNQLLRHVHEPGAIDMLIDLLCLPPRTSESSAFSNATDAESQDNLMMMMMMQPTTELLSSYQCSSVVKHKYYKAVSDSEVLVSLVCRAADSRLNQDHADVRIFYSAFTLTFLQQIKHSYYIYVCIHLPSISSYSLTNSQAHSSNNAQLRNARTTGLS